MNEEFAVYYRNPLRRMWNVIASARRNLMHMESSKKEERLQAGMAELFELKERYDSDCEREKLLRGMIASLERRLAACLASPLPDSATADTTSCDAYTAAKDKDSTDATMAAITDGPEAAIIGSSEAVRLKAALRRRTQEYDRLRKRMEEYSEQITEQLTRRRILKAPATRKWTVIGHASFF